METDPNDDFLRQLRRPEVSAPQHQQQLKLTLLNTRKTAALGVWLVAVPCFFLACVVMKYAFHASARFLDVFFDSVAALDHSSQGWWLSPVFFLLLPLLGFVLNLLSVLHVQLDRPSQQLVLSIKLRPLNLLVLVVSLAVIAILVGYLFVENFIER